jgi:hypothetical protein
VNASTITEHKNAAKFIQLPKFNWSVLDQLYHLPANKWQQIGDLTVNRSVPAFKVLNVKHTKMQSLSTEAGD